MRLAESSALIESGEKFWTCKPSKEVAPVAGNSCKVNGGKKASVAAFFVSQLWHSREMPSRNKCVPKQCAASKTTPQEKVAPNAF